MINNNSHNYRYNFDNKYKDLIKKNDSFSTRLKKERYIVNEIKKENLKPAGIDKEHHDEIKSNKIIDIII